ncbi:MAG: hypothetical protein BWY88_00407 [Synergistetes bacterium ADurb.Bin520]|nr:MAG: hypothetical protein BWY88_00407 [Synergistetes bacterium ADurb.Bin520]
MAPRHPVGFHRDQHLPREGGGDPHPGLFPFGVDLLQGGEGHPVRHGVAFAPGAVGEETHRSGTSRLPVFQAHHVAPRVLRQEGKHPSALGKGHHGALLFHQLLPGLEPESAVNFHQGAVPHHPGDHRHHRLHLGGGLAISAHRPHGDPEPGPHGGVPIPHFQAEVDGPGVVGQGGRPVGPPPPLLHDPYAEVEQARTPQGALGRHGEKEGPPPLSVQIGVAQKLLIGGKGLLRVAEDEAIPALGGKGPIPQEDLSLDGELRRRGAEEVTPLHVQAQLLLGQEILFVPLHQHFDAGRGKVLHLEGGAPQLPPLAAGEAEPDRVGPRPPPHVQGESGLRKALGREHRRAAQGFPAIGARHGELHGKGRRSFEVPLAHQGGDFGHLAGAKDPPGGENEGLISLGQVGISPDLLAVPRSGQEFGTHQEVGGVIRRLGSEDVGHQLSGPGAIPG